MAGTEKGNRRAAISATATVAHRGASSSVARSGGGGQQEGGRLPPKDGGASVTLLPRPNAASATKPAGEAALADGGLVGLAEGTIHAVPLGSIDFENRQFQYRVDPRPGRLVESIRCLGVQEPIVVRPLPNDGGRYQPICGFRRGAAAQLAGLDRVPVIVRDLPDSAAQTLAYTDNEERATLNDVDRACAIATFRQSGQTMMESAEVLGVGGRHARRLQELLTYPDVLRRALADSASGVSTTHALILMYFARKPEAQLDVGAWVRRIRSEKLSVADLKRALRKEARPKRSRKAFVHRRGDIVSFNVKSLRDASDEVRKHARLELEQIIRKTFG